ncbi:LPXTG-site transpeptidase (sortase) family protein [Frigoribacterium sp. PhB160]|uniref:class F sortase n=1 Tax=Frigoribacterium sp. PhB160 TaxID=2485192 RepID=UPI000FACA793|nr:class F sortase [Frigoribacterium sp. PhB160]ROS61340.1 LPXTG-site transpeptidase (sortase) family protein [Frigoribacterium sp. PhB160]
MRARRLLVVAAVVAGASLLTACAVGGDGGAGGAGGGGANSGGTVSAEPSTGPTGTDATGSPESSTTPPAAGPDAAVGGSALTIGVAPARVDVPAIGLSEPLIDLGIAADGAMEVPTDADDVGWFTGGGRPGGRGPTVVAAHVDSATGPAVFARLDEVVVGDEVTLTDVEGGTVAYVVTEVVDVPKAEFPTARVFGAQPTDQLRLITCGGVFDRGSGHYDQNRVVFAEPVG